MVKEYKDFLDTIAEEGYYNPSRQTFGCTNFQSKVKKERYSELQNILTGITSWASGLSNANRFNLIKWGVTQDNYFCPLCKEPKKLLMSRRRLALTCGNKDQEHLDFIQRISTENLKTSNLKKYEVISTAQLKSTQETAKKNNRLKFGCDWPMQNKDVQSKAKVTNINRYGSENPFAVKKIKQKIQETCLVKYGAKNPMQNETVKNKAQTTCLVKYGSKNPMQNEAINTKARLSHIISQATKGMTIQEAEVFMERRKNITPEIMLDFLNKSKHREIKKIEEHFGYRDTSAYKLFDKFNIEYKKRQGDSMPESEIIEFIRTLDKDTKIIQGDRNLIKPKEIDIYLPEYNLAIEYNGLMFHSQGTSKFKMFNTPHKSRNIHLEKTEACEAQDVQLLHIFENEWLDPAERKGWESVIQNKMHKNPVKIAARKCSFATKEQLLELGKTFFDENHLQGGKALGRYRYGLIYEGELVACMTFSQSRFHKEPVHELIRFACKKGCSVMGGASKLMRAFERDQKPDKLISYANRRWSDGGLYKTLGFNLSHIAGVNYFYFKPGDLTLWSRNKFQKHKLHKLLPIFDANKTEQENMYANGYRRIFDSGNYSFVKEYRDQA